MPTFPTDRATLPALRPAVPAPPSNATPLLLVADEAGVTLNEARILCARAGLTVLGDHVVDREGGGWDRLAELAAGEGA